MLTVYKASAGSGKTFQLVVEYLKLILENPYNYKHILAVTFTNKATNEMKSRILEQLYKLANDEKSDYISHLQENNTYSEQFIRQQAKQVIKNILHDYNRFSVNTIDSFTQKVIKSFNRELGISPNFTVELDTDMLLIEAVDNMMARIDKDKDLLKWLKEFSKEKIENNRSQHLETDIISLGSELFKESFQVFFPEEGDSAYTKENLDNFNTELQTLRKNFEKALKEQGKEAVLMMKSLDLGPADFSGGATRSIGSFFVKLSNGQQPNFTKTVRESALDVEKWSSKTSKRRDEILHAAESRLQPKLVEIVNYYDQNSEQYFTAKSVLSQLRMLGILTDLKEEIKRLAHEKGVLMLSDSNLLLSKIIGNTDSPFVYEKIGNFYKHFMLDEFQDTSGLQWFNLKPLLSNSLAEGNKNLIVGDVKQSIYRWRNSDWNILAEQLNSDFTPEQREEITLEYNWRSDKNIINFNNEIIKSLKEQFNEYLFTGVEDKTIYREKLEKIYETFEQKPGKTDKPDTGYIEVNFLPGDEFYEDSASLLVEQVKYLQDKGVKAREIAILIRRNKEGTPIIEQFLSAAKLEENKDYNLSVLSNESLFLHASKAVLFAMSVIELLIDPENKITRAALLQMWQVWLKPELKKKGISIQTVKGQNLLNFEDTKEWHLEENFEKIFSNELNERLAAVKEKVLLSSLDETITYISSLFHLFDLETELPYLQTLIDKAGELKSSLSNDLSNFLLWWNEKGSGTSVNVNEDFDSIRLITVHKSKGLEYKAVLLPFLDWKSSSGGNKSDILWCHSENKPFNSFPLLPVRMSSSLAETEFKEIYFEEKTKSYIDLLNLVYVAFTRAKSVLMVNCPEAVEPKKNAKPSDKPINYILHKTLIALENNSTFNQCWNEDKTQFKSGIVPPEKEEKHKVQSVTIKNYRFFDFSEKIKLRMNAEDFLVEDENHHSVKNTGKIIHDILADIETSKDIEKACTRALLDGKINENEFTEIRQTLNENLNLETVKSWFDGSYRILNERDLLTSGKLLRPDRIMYLNEEAIVVDYKTGEKHPKYTKQVQQYAEELKNSGFKKVSGYLWYLHTGEIEKTCERSAIL